MNKNIWEQVLEVLSAQIPAETLDTWFYPLIFSHLDNHTLHLIAPNEIFQSWIVENHLSQIKEALHQLDLDGYQLAFTCDTVMAAHTPSRGNFRNTENSPLFEELEKYSATQYIDLAPIETPLNPKYTFDTFVVGLCNQFAHAAAQAVSEAPAKTYNPLYIYGGVGLGKTHLMHAIGHAIRANTRYQRLVYISSEKFMNELINAIRYDKIISFREKYRSIDVLLIDDIQFIAGKERTQEEFFHTFNALYESQKQIIISSDCQPREIPTLEERLHSRFEWGLIADIQPPDLETKIAILRRKAELEKIHLEDDVALYIAGKIRSNIRELEGSLVRLVAYSSLKKRPIDTSLAKEVLQNIINEDEIETRLSIENVQKLVANHYGLKITDLKSKNNSPRVAVPRQVAMYLCKVLTKSSLPEIGREFGGKHHTTVLHSVNKIASIYTSDKDFHKIINSLITSLKTS